MLKPNSICSVTNRSHGVVVYTIPEKHIRREFNLGETKKVPYQEILDVAAQPGGRELIYNYLYVAEDEVIKEGLNINPEPEYYLTEDKIDDWMQTCSLDEFKDALDFAPTGIVTLIKSHAVSLPLNNIDKCNAIKDITGFNVLAAIANEKATVEDEESTTTTKERRVVKTAATANAIGRRVTSENK